MIITVVMAYQQKVLARRFQQAGALTPVTAVAPAQLQVKPGMAWYQLLGRGVLSCPGEGRFYLDEAKWQRWRRQQRLFTLGVLALAALIVVAGLLTRH